MNKTILDKCLTGSNLNSGDLIGFYSFGSYSGLITFNEKLDSPQTDSFSGVSLMSNTYPLYSLCDTKSVNSVSGSGYFDGETILQVGESFSNKDWTIFIEYESDDFSGVNADLARVLFSTMDSPLDTSGFNIGLNGANKPYVEYKNKSGINTLCTLNTELGKRNILSFSRSSENSLIEISHHDFLYDNTKFKVFDTPNTENDSGVDKIYSDKSFYIGDFFSTGNSGYTGFSGYMNNVIIFNEHLASGRRHVLAEAIIASDYSGRGMSQQIVYSTGITGGPVLMTGITGSGITGYEVISSGEISGRCGAGVITGYSESGVSGELTGSFYEMATGTGIITGVQHVEVEETVVVDEARRLEFKRTATLSLKPYDLGIDDIEIYCYTGIDRDLNKKPEVRLNYNVFDLGTGHTGQDFAFYRNGFLQRSGSWDGLEIQSGNFYVSGGRYIISTGAINEDGVLDNAVYDYVSGGTVFSGYDPSSAINGYVEITGSDYFGKDIYLNGKKLYILNQYNEVIINGNSGVKINTATLNSTSTGELAFVPKKTFDTRLTETNGDSVQYNPTGFITELIWFNGQRQKRNKDYLIISENSLLNTGSFVRYNDNFTLYEGQDNGIEY